MLLCVPGILAKLINEYSQIYAYIKNTTYYLRILKKCFSKKVPHCVDTILAEKRDNVVCWASDAWGHICSFENEHAFLF